MKIALACLTGIGNYVLEAMMAKGYVPDSVITRKETDPHPYFPVSSLGAYAKSLGLKCAYSLSKLDPSKCEILLIATFHEIVPAHVLEQFKYRFNLHPSMLPKYRGPNPFFWAIKNGEQRSGVTVHELTPNVDAGAIIKQDSIELDSDETQGSLRLKLAMLAAYEVVATLDKIESGKPIKSLSQNEELATYYPQPDCSDLSVDWRRNALNVVRSIRAITPYPGFLYDSRPVKNAQVSDKSTRQISPVRL